MQERKHACGEQPKIRILQQVVTSYGVTKHEPAAAGPRGNLTRWGEANKENVKRAG